MEGNRPKRRKDKYNPYTIFEKDGQYYVSFKDGQGDLHKLEISKVLYDTFDSFELSDLVYLNVVDRHIGAIRGVGKHFEYESDEKAGQHGGNSVPQGSDRKAT